MLKGVSKSIKNPKKWCPGAFRKRSWKQVGKTEHRGMLFLRFFDATWAILNVIWCKAGRQGGPKIESFGTRVRQNLEK